MLLVLRYPMPMKHGSCMQIPAHKQAEHLKKNFQFQPMVFNFNGMWCSLNVQNRAVRLRVVVDVVEFPQQRRLRGELVVFHGVPVTRVLPRVPEAVHLSGWARFSHTDLQLNLSPILRYVGSPWYLPSCLQADLADTLADGRGRSCLPCHQVAPRSATRGRR